MGKEKTLSVFKYILSFLKWTALGASAGVIVGLAGAAFAYCLQLVTDFRTAHPLLVLGLPLAGLLIVFLYHSAGIRESRGTNLVLASIRTDEPIPFAMAPLIFAGTVLTHLFGGSAGREGAALQLGGSIAQNLARKLRLSSGSQKLLTMCGMSACFSALFGTPMSAAFFAMEVISVGIMHYSALVPCAVASVTAAYLSRLLGIAPARFSVSGIPSEFSVPTMLRVFALAALCAGVSILFCVILKYTSAFYASCFKNSYLRVACGGILVAVFAMILRSQDYLGAGTQIIARAFAGEAVPLAFLLKIIFTAITLEAGFKGGEIVPTFFYWRNVWLHRRITARPQSVVRCRSRYALSFLRRYELPYYDAFSQPRAVRCTGTALVLFGNRRQLYAVRIFQPLQQAENHVLQGRPGIYRYHGTLTESCAIFRDLTFYRFSFNIVQIFYS